MALLSSCWLIIECFIIPDGFAKWYCLSFYIHPFFLVFCQIFLWFRWPTYIILFLPYRFTCYLCSLVCFSFRRFIIIIRSYTGYRSRDTEVVYDVPEHRNIPQLIARNDQNQIVDMYSTATSIAAFVQSNYYEVSVSETSEIGFVQVHYESSKELGDADEDEDEDSSSGEEEGLSSGDEFSTLPSSISPPRDVEMNLYLPISLSDCSSNTIVEQELIDNRGDAEEEIDAFYKNYTERMRWFDVLNHDRAFALSTILSKQSSKDIISIDQSEEEGDMSWAKMGKKRMVNSLENDFEMVYVAQSCLTWEALHYQHQKVESLIECSSSTSTSTSPIPNGGAFHYNYSSRVAGNFQKFKILLERFMEDEMFGGKRCWNYVQKRSSLKSLLQVPDISEGSNIEEEKQGRKGEAIGATEMLKVIEKCIKTFCLFLQNERRKQWWKANSLLWTRPPLEDPRNLKLLHHLIKTLQQKELRLKDLKGKKRFTWWRRTVNRLEETQKKEMLFTTIEMKLVSRVLSMPMISTLQLNWCQEKLNNIDFKEGKVIRSCSIGPLFPSS